MSGIFLNDDFMRFVNSKYHDGYVFGEVTLQHILDYINTLRNTQVTDFAFNVNAQFSYSPSSVWMTAEDKYQTKVENGISVDYRFTYLAVWHDIFTRQKIDMYAIWVDELRKMNINPWISFRLNDTHDNVLKAGGTRRAVYTDKARENGIVRTKHRDKNGYYDDCLDFKHEDVRRRNLDYIDEQLDRYDVYGVELDWMREPYCCSPGEEDGCRKLMNGFFGDVRDIMAKYEKKYGHPIKLSVRTFRDPITTYDAGLDIFHLINDKIIDLVVPTPRWRTCDSDMPIYAWKKMFGNCAIAAGCDILYLSSKNEDIFVNHDTICALSMQYLSSGADYIYLFNYTYLEDSTVYSYIGDVKTMADKKRRHIVSFQDVGYIYSTLYKPLPMEITKLYKYLRIQTGNISEGSEVVLRIGCDSEKLTVFVNSDKCRYLGKRKIEPEYYDGYVMEYEVQKYNQNDQVLEIKCVDGAMLSYAEIMVIPQQK